MAIHHITDLNKLYVALITKDESPAPTFEKPVYLPGVKEIGIKIKTNTDMGYAEGIVWDTESTMEGADIDINIVDLTDKEEAMLLGHKIATEGGIIYGANDISPEVAILFKAMKANGKARYVTLYRGKFEDSDEDYKGKEGKTDFQSRKLTGSFSPLKSNGMFKYKVDEEDKMDDTKFFAEVTIPTVKTPTKP